MAAHFAHFRMKDLFDGATRKRLVELYVAAVIAVLVALALTLWLRPVFHHNPFLFYYTAVIVAAWLGGAGPGLLATLLASGFYAVTFNSHRLTTDDMVQVGLFMLVGTVTSLLSEGSRRSKNRLQNQLRQQAIIAELGRLGQEEADMGTIIQETVVRVPATLGVEHCELLELMPDGRSFLLRAGIGWRPGLVGELKISAGPDTQAGFTLSTGRPVVLEDLRREKRFTGPPLLSEHAIISGVSVVVGRPSRPFGVFTVHSREPHAFSSDDVHFVQAAGNLLANLIERRRTRQQLEQSEKRFRTLTELIPQMVWSTTPEGSVDYISPSWSGFTGVSQADSLGTEGWKRVLHPDDQQEVLRHWEESITTGEPYEVECRLKRAGGDYGLILARGLPVRNAEGHIEKWFGTCTDINDQKLAEAALRESEKLVAAGRLASTVAHEINNPLACVTNLVYLASQPETERSKSKEYLAQADKQLQRIAHMVRQTLTFVSRPSAPGHVDPAELLSGLLELFDEKIRAKQIRAERSYKGPPEVVASAEDLRHVLSTVILNAIDASAPGGAVVIRLRTIHDLKRTPREGLLATVADHGPGIAPKDQPHIFEPFFTTKTEVGTGLGLWLAKDIVERHQGWIRFRSSVVPGHSGTVFQIFFPVRMRAALEGHAAD
jgi:PAS domain S-box-containing protein